MKGILERQWSRKARYAGELDVSEPIDAVR